MKEIKFKGDDNFIYGLYEILKKVIEEKGFEKVMDSSMTESEKIAEFKKEEKMITMQLKDVHPLESEVKMEGEGIEDILIDAIKKYIGRNLIPILKSIDFTKAKKFEEFLSDL
jgi:hypothetical protein